jgi:hypothetical protein
MNSTSLQEASIWMASALGLDPIKDRTEVVSYVNKYRNLLYNSWDRVQLFDDYKQCFTLQSMNQECSGNSCSTYKGFTATLDMGGVVGAWESLEQVTLRSRWRQVHRGMSPVMGPEVELVPMAGSFATERDMTTPARLSVYAHAAEDAGKTVMVRAKDSDGRERTLKFVLGKDTRVVVNVIVKAVTSVTLPADLCGSVELHQDGGSILSIYPPGVITPQYRRYRVNSGFSCATETLFVQSARVYLPVTEDHDVIEVGDQLVIEAAGRFFKYGENTSDRKERVAALGYREEMFDYIGNIKSRDEGREKHDGHFTMKPKHKRRRRLPGYRRRKIRG